jgi:hypothetical protein
MVLSRKNNTVFDSAIIVWGKPMKPTSIHKNLNIRTSLLLTALLFICVLAACEGANDSSDSTPTRDTGSIAFNVVWDQRSDSDTDYQTRAVVCGSDPVQVDTVRAVIVNTESSVLRRGGPWECSAGSGTVQGVPVGSGYMLLFYGHNEFGRTTYSGAELGISVETGINDIGTIDANRFFSDIIDPPHTSSNIDPDSATFSWTYASGAARYQLWISESQDLLGNTQTFDTDDLFFTVPPGFLAGNTTYYWTVFAIDIDNNRSWFYGDIYSFTTASATMDDNYEDNDMLGTAYDISGDEQTYLSSIDGLGVANSGDDDYYQIEVTPGYEYLTIDCFFADDGGDIDIKLYTFDGTLVTGAATATDNEHIELDVTSYGSGIYYIYVYLFSGESNTYDLWWDDTDPNP